jgi:biopolymer transport protein ExbD
MKKRFSKLSRKKRVVSDLDITSLLDVLVILLVFLLKNYNPSDLKIDLISKLDLPESQSIELGHDSIIIQIDKNQEVFINNKSIGIVAGNEEFIPFLGDKLNEYKDAELKKELALGLRTPSSEIDGLPMNKRKVNIVLDKTIPYSTMRKVMHTAALSGFPQFKFIVKGKFQ